MTTDELIAKINSMDCYKVQTYFERTNDHHCPCFYGRKKIDGKMITFDGRCWRLVKGYNQTVTVSGSLSRSKLQAISDAIAAKLTEQKWYRPYDALIIYKSPKATERR
jgi:hypothetical protein